jgi:SAM-dependent methyltransferase
LLKINVRAKLADIRYQSSARVLARELEASRYAYVFDDEDLSQHYGDQLLDDPRLQNITKTFILERIDFIEECLGREEIAQASFADMGDSSGIFLKALGKHGVSFNISQAALQNIQRKNILAIKGDLEHLPFRDGSVDHVLCFEVLEHMPNPILALRELERVCSKTAFISIPHVTRTRIYPFGYDQTRPHWELHVFEFSDVDFLHVISHTGFKLKSRKVVEVLTPSGLYERLAFYLWGWLTDSDLFYGVFKRFAVYQLAKDSGSSS